jgi:hypothetical protein
MESVQLLLEAGADAAAVDRDSATPAALAAQAGHAQLVELISGQPAAPPRRPPPAGDPPQVPGSCSVHKSGCGSLDFLQRATLFRVEGGGAAFLWV